MGKDREASFVETKIAFESCRAALSRYSRRIERDDVCENERGEV